MDELFFLTPLNLQRSIQVWKLTVADCVPTIDCVSFLNFYILLRSGHMRLPFIFQWPKQVTFHWPKATPNFKWGGEGWSDHSCTRRKVEQKARKHSIQGLGDCKLHYCSIATHLPAVCGQSALFCTNDFGFSHVTYFGEWNITERARSQFWEQTLRVCANSPTTYLSCNRPWEECSPGSHCFFSVGSEMRDTWNSLEPMLNQSIPEVQILE